MSSALGRWIKLEAALRTPGWARELVGRALVGRFKRRHQRWAHHARTGWRDVPGGAGEVAMVGVPRRRAREAPGVGQEESQGSTGWWAW